jgi:hypothetical protein
VDFVLPASATSVVGVSTLAPVTAGVPLSAPTAFAIRSLGPSPFAAGGGASLAVRFALPAAARVRVEVLDVSGRRVATLLDEALAAGEHGARWDGSSAAGVQALPGLYLVRVATDQGTRTGRLIVVR